MVFEGIGRPLQARDIPMPEPGPGQVRIKVNACGVCRTDLHIYEGDLKGPKLPLVLGHEIIGRVDAIGPAAGGIALNQRVGVPWLGWTCGTCGYCSSGRENLCDRGRFTGYDLDGGYAEFVVADHRYCFPVPNRYADAEAAPLLCAGMIGYRSYRMAGPGRRLGLYGFGAAAHLIVQVAKHEGKDVYAFTRPGDEEAQVLAKRLGAKWSGNSDTLPPEPLDAAILYAPVGALVPQALQAVVKGGMVVCAGIHMTSIPSFPYGLLWGEREIRSVANLTREDGRLFLDLAARLPLHTEITIFPLPQADRALQELKAGRIRGAAVLTVAGGP